MQLRLTLHGFAIQTYSDRLCLNQLPPALLLHTDYIKCNNEITLIALNGIQANKDPLSTQNNYYS